MKRKGVSPLIAAVLLIAFTMAVAAILTAWVTTFTQEQTQQLGNESSEQIDCTYGQLEVFDASTDSGQATIAITNNGREDFDEVIITALSDGEVLNSTTMANLSVGETDSTDVTWTESTEATTLRVATSQCPSVSAEWSSQS